MFCRRNGMGRGIVGGLYMRNNPLQLHLVKGERSFFLAGMQYRKPAPIPPATKGMVKVYPNPTKGLLTIETDLSDSEVATIQLINQLGQPCASASFKGNTFVWDLSSYPLAKGLYFIQIRTQSINHQTKVVYEN